MPYNLADPIHAVFNNPRLRKILVKIRYPIVLVLFILAIPHIKPSLFFHGLLVSLFGELIQLWCFGSLEKNRTLSTKGPYLVTRNPMYLGRFFLLLGFLLLFGNAWIVLAFVFVYYFYMFNRVKREEKSLSAIFGADYDIYCREVNRFWPSIKRFDRESFWFFRWRVFFENHGHWNLALFIAGYVLLYLFAFKA